MEKRSPHLFQAHRYWKELLQAKDLAIDATCGNGHDTLILARLLLDHPESWVYSLDVQQNALDQTQRSLQQSVPASYLQHFVLKKWCHSKIDALSLPCSPKLIVYNLGYLPGGDKSITTQAKTTLQSLQKAIHLLAHGGAISVTCYPGHSEGKKEEEVIMDWAQNLTSTEWQVCHHRWMNRAASPSLLWICSIKPADNAKNVSHRS